MEKDKIKKINIFKNIVNGIKEKQPLHRPKIESFLERQSAEYFLNAEKYLDALFSVAKEKFNYSIDDFIESYIEFCKMIVQEAIYFKKHGVYRSKNQQNNLLYYQNNDYMFSYMFGLGISQFLWPNHLKMWSFFKDICKDSNLNVKNYLEVGPGHGFYLCEAMKCFKEASIHLIDLSEASIDITKKMCKKLMNHSYNLTTINKDFLDIKPQKKTFDLIVICEVLEHLDDPLSFLKHTHKILNKNGLAIISTCANSACVDHIYLYHSIEHIKSHIVEENFRIEKELALPVGEIDEKMDWHHLQIESNYISLIRKLE